MEQKQELHLLNYIALLSIFLFAGAGSFMNAAVQTMMEAWPELSATSVRQVTSLPSLIALPVTIAVGTVAGKRLTFRFCSILGTALILLGGIAPFFFYRSWALILVFRALVGVGVGFIAVRNSLILKTVPEGRQAAIVGYGSAIFNAGGMLAGPIVGILCAIGWRYSFLYDLLAGIPLLIMIFFLKEPGRTREESAGTARPSATAAKTKREKMDPRLILYVVFQFVGTMALYPLLSGMSTFMAVSGAGTAFVAGLAVSTYNVGGVLINVVLSPVLQRLGRHALLTTHLVFAAGLGLVLFVPSVLGIFSGALICGMAFNMIMSVYQLYNGALATPGQATLLSSLLIAALGLGNFVSVYYINFCHSLFHLASDIHSTYLGSILVYILLGVLCVVLGLTPQDQKGTADA